MMPYPKQVKVARKNMYNDTWETVVWHCKGISVKMPSNMAKFYEKSPFFDQLSCP